MSDILDQLRRVAYVMFKDGWQSKETAGLAFLEIVKLRRERDLLREALIRYGDESRMGFVEPMELQQVIDAAFEMDRTARSTLEVSR